MPRGKRFFGNWKMNGSFAQADTFFSELFELSPNFNLTGAELIGIAPAACYLDYVNAKIASGNISTLKLGAQDGSKVGQNAGAYTGQLSMSMYADCGASSVIIGNSEDREYLGFTNEDCNYRVLRALEAGLKILYCVGENLTQREAGEGEQVILEQISEGLSGATAEQLRNNIMIIYEPVWAIGTGKIITSEQVDEMCAFIRSAFAESFDQTTSENVYILFAGPVKPSNAEELGHLPNVDGFLIAAAALKPDQFLTIIENATTH